MPTWYNNEAAPRQGAAFLFMLFARQADSAEPCARSTSLCSLRFLLGLLFHDNLPCFGPLSQSKQWQQADERGVNRSWQRGNNLALLTALDASPRSLRRAGCTAQIGWLEGVGRAILSRIKATEVTHELSHPRPRGPSVRSSFRALGRRTCCARCHPAPMGRAPAA